MRSNPFVRRIVVGVDGSDHAAAALDWAMALARSTEAEIIAVFAIPPPNYLEYGAGYGAPVTPPELDPEWRLSMKRSFEQDWCAGLRASGLAYRTMFEDGRAPEVIADVAEREDADLVVVGRRGLGGVAELVLGSVSHALSHHCSRPVVLITRRAVAKREEPASASAATGA